MNVQLDVYKAIDHTFSIMAQALGPILGDSFSQFLSCLEHFYRSSLATVPSITNLILPSSLHPSIFSLKLLSSLTLSFTHKTQGHLWSPVSSLRHFELKQFYDVIDRHLTLLLLLLRSFDHQKQKIRN